jgi:hypothetical protein
MAVDLWSDDPKERLDACADLSVVSALPALMSKTAPMTPWPFGMPTSINPFVVFVGASPGNSPSSRRNAAHAAFTGLFSVRRLHLRRRGSIRGQPQASGIRHAKDRRKVRMRYVLSPVLR